MRFVQMMNADICFGATGRRRCWFEAGVPVAIAPAFAMTVFFDVADGGEQYRPVIEIAHPRGVLRYPLPDGCLLDITGWCGLKALPRAVEFAGARPSRLLIEFCEFGGAQSATR